MLDAFAMLHFRRPLVSWQVANMVEFRAKRWRPCSILLTSSKISGAQQRSKPPCAHEQKLINLAQMGL